MRSFSDVGAPLVGAQGGHKARPYSGNDALTEYTWRPPLRRARFSDAFGIREKIVSQTAAIAFGIELNYCNNNRIMFETTSAVSRNHCPARRN